MFEDPLFTVMLLSVFAVLVVLMIGLGGFAGGGAFNKKNGNKMMRYRIIAQAVAVVIIVIFVWVRGGTS